MEKNDQLISHPFNHKIIFKKIVARLDRTLKAPLRYIYDFSREFRIKYWQSRAKDIDNQWGGVKKDYDVLRQIMNALQSKRVLDIGCGSGRLFPLYIELGQEIVGQDISGRALELCRSRYNVPDITLTNVELLDLSYQEGYFDLVVSSRVLQHIGAMEIKQIIYKLSKLGRAVYINEMPENDYKDRYFFMFLHDYENLFWKMVSVS